MFKEVNYEDTEIQNNSNKQIFIDVRSPSEYNKETIPGAINIPIFDDEERKIIGKTYKKVSKDRAKEMGVAFVSKKLPHIYQQVSKLNEDSNSIILFCSRGGFRSSSLVPLFKSLGINATKIKDGYKGYRNYINAKLPEIVQEVKFIVLYGNTGTGKTNILKNLNELGMNIVDLEGYANHRGSLLGSVGLGEQNTQKMFESLIYQSLKNRTSNFVFIEGESKRIGKVLVPDYLFQAMKDGIHIKIEASIETRIKNIVEDYVGETDDELINSLEYFRRHLGNEDVDRYIELVKDQNYNPIIRELINRYYDPLYERNIHHYCASFLNKDTDQVSKEIIQWLNEDYKSK